MPDDKHKLREILREAESWSDPAAARNGELDGSKVWQARLLADLDGVLTMRVPARMSSGQKLLIALPLVTAGLLAAATLVWTLLNRASLSGDLRAIGDGLAGTLSGFIAQFDVARMPVLPQGYETMLWPLLSLLALLLFAPLWMPAWRRSLFSITRGRI